MLTVDLTVYDFFTNVVLTLGWILNNAAWGVLTATMIAAVPFVALVVREFFEARREGEDEGNKGLLALNRIETRLYAMLLIYMFCALPLLNVTFAPVKVDQAHLAHCGVRLTGGGTTSAVGGAIGGVSPNIPVWWAVTHAVSRGVTGAVLTALPCQTDYLYLRTEIDNSAIHDPVLRREVARFQRVCYGAARSKLFQHSAGLSAAAAKDVDWIGSRYFLNTPGYYDSLSANRPVKGFPYDPATDFGRGTAPAQGGYPTCQQWWSAAGIGLKDRLHDQIDPSFWSNFTAVFTSSTAADYAIRGLLHNRVGGAQGNAGGASTDIGGGLNVDSAVGGVVGFLGTLWNTMPAMGKKDVMSRALPMVQHLVMMALIVAIPFILVMSAYSFKVAGLVTFSYFGLSTITIWFEISRWMSNNLVHMVYSSDAAKLGFISGIGSTYDVGVLGLVQVAMQLLFPLIWISLLGWSGWAVGSGMGNLVKSGSDEAGKAGENAPFLK